MSGIQVPKPVDAHVHLAGDGWKEVAQQAGMAAIRDAGKKPNANRVRTRSTDDPVLVSCCWALYKAGGYGSRFGLQLTTTGSVEAEVNTLRQAGADIVKVMASGMVSLKHPGTVTAGGFDRDELHIIVREAAAAGLDVMAHANGEEAIIAAAEAGVRSIEHGFFMTARALELMARNGTFWVPTTGALVRAVDAAAASGGVLQFVADLVRRHLDMVRLAHSLGVPLAAGTDCVLPDQNYRQAFEVELDYFRQAGLPEDEVERIATDNGQRLLGISFT